MQINRGVTYKVGEEGKLLVAQEGQPKLINVRVRAQSGNENLFCNG